MTDIRALIADDAFAASFQSLGQYRTALLAALAQPELQGPTAWMYRGEPDFDGERWRENWKVTLDEKLARYKSGNKEPVPLWDRPPLPENNND
jgi:hypothetical protein